MSRGQRRIAGVAAALACLAGASLLHRGLRDSAENERSSRARDQVATRVRALAEALQRSSDQLQTVAVTAAAVQDLQVMVRSGVDAPTFNDYLVNEVSWKGFRTPPLSSAIYLDRQRMAQTSATFPGEGVLGYLVEVAGVNGRATLVVEQGTINTVAAARVPVVTRGEAPREAVVVLARPLDLRGFEGPWLLSDGRQLLAAGPSSEAQTALKALIGREAEATLVIGAGAAAAHETQPGLWAWTLAPLQPAGRQGPLFAGVFGVGGLLALVALVLGFRNPGTDEREKAIADASERLRQSQEQLQRLSQQLDAIPRPTTDTGTEVTSPSLTPLKTSRYEVLAQLGVGGMAVVYLAVTRGVEGFRRAFVIKRLRPEVLGNPAAVTQFIDEARLGSSLVHSNIVPVFDFGRDDEGYYLAQEYILGRDVDNVRRVSIERRNKALELPLVLYLAQETLKALHYAHGRTNEAGAPSGLVHRDISPNNLMISAQGEVKLLDLGIAKSTRSLNLTQTQDGMIKGNVFYMSPEQARGLPLDGRGDLFSLGLVLFTAFTGDPLYRGTTNYELLQRAGLGLGPTEWDRVKALPPELAKLLTRVLQLEPADRFATADEFADAIPKAAVGSAPEMLALMQLLFAEDFRKELAKLELDRREDAEVAG